MNKIGGTITKEKIVKDIYSIKGDAIKFLADKLGSRSLEYYHGDYTAKSLMIHSFHQFVHFEHNWLYMHGDKTMTDHRRWSLDTMHKVINAYFLSDDYAFLNNNKELLHITGDVTKEAFMGYLGVDIEENAFAFWDSVIREVMLIEKY